MAVSISRKTVDSIKDELRNQVRLWNYQLMHDNELNGHFKSSLENTLEKCKIIQRIRLENLDRLFIKLENGFKYREDVIKEIQTYWTALLPDIKNVFNAFHRMNMERNFYDEIEKLEIPETLHLPTETHQEEQQQQPSTHSTQNKSSTSHSISRRKSTYSSFSTTTTLTSGSRARPIARPRRVYR